MCLAGVCLTGCGSMGLTTGYDPYDVEPETEDTGTRSPYGDEDPNDDSGTDDSDEPTEPDDTDVPTVPEDTDPPEDTGEPAPPPSAPVITSLVATDLTDVVEVAFSFTDADGDVEGGILSLTVDGNVHDLVVPDDLDVYNPKGASRVLFERGDCDAGTTFAVDAVLSDVAGLSSKPANDSVLLGGWAAELSEAGELSSTSTDIGSGSPPMQLCGTIHTASNDGKSYTGDMDWATFTPTTSGTWTFDLTWDNALGDYDLHLYNQAQQRIASAIIDGTTQPEQISFSLIAGQTYHLQIAAWSGGIGGWSVEAY